MATSKTGRIRPIDKKAEAANKLSAVANKSGKADDHDKASQAHREVASAARWAGRPSMGAAHDALADKHLEKATGPTVPTGDGKTGLGHTADEYNRDEEGRFASK